MQTLKIIGIVLVSFLFVGCPQSDDDIVVAPEMRLKIENTGTDIIQKLIVETAEQTITLNLFEINTPTNYQVISNLNAGSLSTITFEDALGNSVSTQSTFGVIGDYKLDVVASTDLSTTSVSLNIE